MAETETSSSNNNDNKNNIPIEFVTDEEMAFIEAAYASVTSSSSSIFARSLSSCCTSSTPSSSPRLHNNSLSINSITLLSKRKLSSPSSCAGDIEDTLRFVNSRNKPSISDSFLRRFRKKRALSVTDLTSTEWCPKQMEFSLLLGGKKVNQFMKAGIARHAKLEAEVITRVEVKIRSQEDRWALKLLNFITGVNQLLFEGLTRELPMLCRRCMDDRSD
ncbi:hypothetical protein KIW84_076089 [Lathyrus oleraceus]|uniref:Uncharacterized protein n=1 Tax=Pisum sativum TaxID=3888 RepID=A0A9D4VWR2_PEA|nr:hypothetical protein KIW84_076089 [Pisum sativum]